MCPVRGTRPEVGRSPVIPQQCAGTRMLPPVSLPMSSGDPPVAMMAAAPRCAAARTRDIKRVVGAAVNLVVGLEAPRQRQLRGVGLAENDSAGIAQSPDHGRIVVGDELTPSGGTAGGDDASRIQRVLDGDGDAVQRSPRLASCKLRIGRFRFGLGTLSRELHHRIQLAVDLFDARQQRRDHLDGRYPALAYHACQRRCRRPYQLIHISPRSHRGRSSVRVATIS